MARLSLTFPLFLLSLLYAPNVSESATATATATEAAAASFIKASCRSTRFPVLCVQSLSAHASTIQKSPKRLVIESLSVSVERAQSTQAFFSKLSKFRGLKRREYAAIKDCLEEVGEGVDQLGKSILELRRLGRGPRGLQFKWHMSNLKTWVSAALTDDSACLDGFSGRDLDGRIKTSIRRRITEVAQVTSNALALCNNFAGEESIN